MDGESSSAADKSAEKAQPLNDLKAGHPPATKVGGMRVVQHHHKAKDGAAGDAKSGTSPPKKSVDDDEKEEFGEDKPAKPQANVVISGAKATEDSAFPTEAVKAFHEKPLPTHQQNAHAAKPKVIQQPRK